MDFLAFLAAFGAGSIVTTFVQFVLTNRSASQRRMYEERREAYLGLAEAWMRQEQTGVTDSNMLELGHWFLRCQFVAPPSMLGLLEEWAASKPETLQRIDATKRLKAAMRIDLVRFK